MEISKWFPGEIPEGFPRRVRKKYLKKFLDRKQNRGSNSHELLKWISKGILGRMSKVTAAWITESIFVSFNEGISGVISEGIRWMFSERILTFT